MIVTLSISAVGGRRRRRGGGGGRGHPMVS